MTLKTTGKRFITYAAALLLLGTGTELLAASRMTRSARTRSSASARTSRSRTTRTPLAARKPASASARSAIHRGAAPVVRSRSPSRVSQSRLRPLSTLVRSPRNQGAITKRPSANVRNLASGPLPNRMSEAPRAGRRWSGKQETALVLHRAVVHRRGRPATAVPMPGGCGHHHRHHLGGHHDSRHTSISVGFGFTSLCPVPVVEPAYTPAAIAVPAVIEPAPVVAGPTCLAPPMAVEQPSPPLAAIPGPAATGTVLFEGIISREDDIAPEALLTVDGILVEIEDADECPTDVDLEIRVGGCEYDYEDLPIGASIPAHGRSGQLYYVNVLDLDGETETMRFCVTK